MTEDQPESSLAPVIHVQSENPSFTTNIILTEVNYDVWSQIMEMQIAGREKLEYHTGKTLIPQITDAAYAKWYAENQKTALAKAFYDGSDESQLFALKQRAFSTKQGGHSLSTYYVNLVKIFQELDHRDRIVMKDPEDVVAYKKLVERLRVHFFLNGLDANFEQIRGEILRKDPALDLEATYAYVRHDVIRRAALQGEP
eukprot:PITA_24930